MKRLIINWDLIIALLIGISIFFVTHPVGSIGIDISSNKYQSVKDSQWAGSCSGETKLLRKCLPGFTQACVDNIICKCNDGWVYSASGLDGCVIWSGKDIPDNVTRYAFPDECKQSCRTSGSLRAE